MVFRKHDGAFWRRVLAWKTGEFSLEVLKGQIGAWTGHIFTEYGQDIFPIVGKSSVEEFSHEGWRRPHLHGRKPRATYRLPSKAFMGSIDFSCFGVSACASGSLLAAAVMALSSCALGIRTVIDLDFFDIVFYLATTGTAQTDDPSSFTTIYQSHALRNYGFRRTDSDTP
jgi:hypothetical protein